MQKYLHTNCSSFAEAPNPGRSKNGHAFQEMGKNFHLWIYSSDFCLGVSCKVVFCHGIFLINNLLKLWEIRDRTNCSPVAIMVMSALCCSSVVCNEIEMNGKKTRLLISLSEVIKPQFMSRKKGFIICVLRNFINVVISFYLLIFIVFHSNLCQG